MVSIAMHSATLLNSCGFSGFAKADQYNELEDEQMGDHKSCLSTADLLHEIGSGLGTIEQGSGSSDILCGLMSHHVQLAMCCEGYVGALGLVKKLRLVVIRCMCI